MLKNAENDSHKERIEADMKNNCEKLLRHQNFAPTLPGARIRYFPGKWKYSQTIP